MHHLAVRQHCTMLTSTLLIYMAPALQHVTSHCIVSRTNEQTKPKPHQGKYFYPLGKTTLHVLCMDKVQNYEEIRSSILKGFM